jgi:hypothetical protein
VDSKHDKLIKTRQNPHDPLDMSNSGFTCKNKDSAWREWTVGKKRKASYLKQDRLTPIRNLKIIFPNGYEPIMYNNEGWFDRVSLIHRRKDSAWYKTVKVYLQWV